MVRTPPPDLPLPRKSLIIGATRRSGSTILSARIRSTGVLGVPAEYMNPVSYEESTSIYDRCIYALRRGVTPNGVCSLKLLTSQFDELRREIRLTEWFPDPVWVYLERNDILAQAISLTIARQTNAWTSRTLPTRDPVYSSEKIEEALWETVQDRERWTVFFSRSGIEPIRLVYEDIVSDFASPIRRICQAVGISEPPSVANDSFFQIQRTSLNEEWRNRFVEERGNPDDFYGTRASS